MKILLFILISTNLLYSASSIKYSAEIQAKISPFAYKILELLEEKKFDEVRSEFVCSEINKQSYISCLIRVESDTKEEILLEKDVLISTQAGNIWSVLIPFKTFRKVLSIRNINYVQIDKPFSYHLDEVNKILNTEEIHFAEQISQRYTGKGVIIGVIDFGFDLNHTFFKDENGNTRIKKIWIQYVDENNRPPSGFKYGHEVFPKDFDIVKTDSRNASHGSHVTGIATGSYMQGIEAYNGIAPESEIVMVTPNITSKELNETNASSILDGIKYIFDYANSKGKSAVINISLGTSIGPHDGTALFDQACGNLISNNYGNILVTSAGNDGMTNFVYQKDISEPAQLLFKGYDLLGFDSDLYLDLWGEEGSNFCVELGVIQGESIEWGNKFCTTTPGNYKGINIGFSSKRIRAGLSIAEYSFNQKPRIFINYLLSYLTKGTIRITNATGKVYIWNCGLGGSTSLEFLDSEGFNSANNYNSIAEIGGNSENFITVGSYNSRVNEDLIVYGDLFFISNFSSLGNTIDGRLKPEILAPGSSIISSYNKNQIDFSDLKIEKFDQKGFPFGYMSGTSMSTPVITGLIALMLEANPLLEVSDIRNILANTSLNDQYTLLAEARQIGNGKVDLFNSIKNAQELEKQPNGLLYPNPFSNKVNYSVSVLDSIESVKYEIYNNLGSLIESDEIGTKNSNIININTSKFADGLYLIRIKETYIDGSVVRSEFLSMKNQ